MNFNKARLKAINYFRDAYKIAEYKIVGLNGIQKENYRYPWELPNVIRNL